MKRILIWKGLQWESLEYFTIENERKSIVAYSRLVGVKDQVPFSIFYKIIMDTKWVVSQFEIVTSGQGKVMRCSTDGNGQWFDNLRGNSLNHLAGCYDVDISLSPFTNTLPINRLGLKENERSVIQVLYIGLPDIQMEKVEQAYTRIDKNKYKYEGATSGFEAELDVDEMGLVTGYPTLFSRIWPKDRVDTG